MINKVCSNSKI